MTQGRNHPKKGSSIKVQPLTKEKDVKAIKKLLSDNPRNLCLFTMGINTNLRASDLVRITAGAVRHCKPGDSFNIKEKKTGKARKITVNNAVFEAVHRLLASRDYYDDDPLFRSARGGPLREETVNHLVKEWTNAINLKGNYGAHSLRKTFGYMQRTRYSVDIPTLMVMFNHSSQRQTLDYLCIQPEEIHEAYMHEI